MSVLLVLDGDPAAPRVCLTRLVATGTWDAIEFASYDDALAYLHRLERDAGLPANSLSRQLVSI